MKPEKGAKYRREKILGGVLFYRNYTGEKWKCRVRLHTGEVVEAVYDERAATGPHHWVEHEGELMQTVGLSEHIQRSGEYHARCRLIGPSCALLPVGVSV